MGRKCFVPANKLKLTELMLWYVQDDFKTDFQHNLCSLWEHSEKKYYVFGPKPGGISINNYLKYNSHY